MWNTTFASAYFATLWRLTVLPVPKAPGIAPVPPFDIGKNESRTLCPVMRGISGSSRPLMGLGVLTGHVWWSFSSSFSPDLPSAVTTVSSTLNFPALATSTTLDFGAVGGTRILCSMSGDSATVPRTEPPSTLSPFFTVGAKAHSLLNGMELAVTPRVMNAPAFLAMTSRGRWRPS